MPKTVDDNTHFGALCLEARLLVALYLLVAGLLGCGGGQSRPTSVLKSIEEVRARGIIEQALFDNGTKPAKGRVVELQAGGTLTEDMGIEGEIYGIAYMTEPEASKVGAAVPSYQRGNEQLRLVKGKDGSITLVLFEQAYQYDAGEEHSSNIIAAEKKLGRDVADFVVHVVKTRKSP